MNRKTFKLNRIIVAMLLGCISTFAFVFTRSSASEQVAESAVGRAIKVESKKSAASANSESVVLKAEKRGFPLMNLRDGKQSENNFLAADDTAMQSFGASGSRPLALTSADFNADGAQDLVISYKSGDGGYLAFYQGSLNTLWATTPEVFEGFQQGRFPDPFLPDVKLTKLPVAPDFVAAGDFNRDGAKDLVAAQKGDTKAFLLLGYNSARKSDVSYVEFPGSITAIMSERIDAQDNQTDLAVAVTNDEGAQLLIYKGGADAFGDSPETYQLPAEATSLAIGQLDNDYPMDVLATTGGKLAIVHGALPGAGETAQVEILDQGFEAAAVRIGNFVWDRENRPEIGVLDAGGAIRILERGTLDKKPFTSEEYKRRPLELRKLIAEEETRRNLNYQPRKAKTALEKWTEVDNMQVASPPTSLSAASSAAYFTSARMTPFGTEDLLIVDAANRKLQVLVANNDELKNTGESYSLSASGGHALVTLDVEGATPVAALPMRLNVMNRPGIVLLNAETSEPMLAPSAPANTFNVTKTADTNDNTCNADCSFREALHAANTATDSDLINLPAGTYTISPALGPPDSDTSVDPIAEQSGDWDAWYDTSIQGANQATTILQGAAAQPGHDRVLDAIQNGPGLPDLTIGNLIIRNGRCRVDYVWAGPQVNWECVDGGGLHYGVDNLSLLTVSNTTIDNNRTDVNTVTGNVNNSSPAQNGGGVYSGQSDANFTNVTITNNTNGFVESGCAGATQCGGEGGGIFAGFRFTSNPIDVTFTNCNISNNTANSTNGLGGRGGAYAGSPDSVTISGGTFNNNVATVDGGAMRLFTPTTISNATISGNSARANGGGIWSDPLANDNTPLTNTFTNVVMKGNTADSDGVIGTNTNNRGDGGAIFHGRGTLNLVNPTIGGTGAGEGNTAFDGGGVARTYSQFVSAVFNASTLNINNGGSIVGNTANNNGGGVLNDATKTAAAGNASNLNIGSVTAVTLTNNNAKNHGGGIAVITNGGTTPAATANLNNMTLRNNTANSDSSGGGDGGGFYQNSTVSGGGTTFTGTLTVGGSGFTNAAVNGGGISNTAGTLTLPANASITFNTASGSGGGIHNLGTINSFSGATISNNSATTSGGGIFNGGTITVSGATINSNSATTGSSVTQNAGTFFSAGTNTLGNNLAISGGTFNAQTSTVNLAGNFSFTGGTFTQGTSTFNFNGSSAQTISGTVTFNNLTVNNPAGVSLNSNETVAGTLTLTSGVLGIGSNTLTLNSTVSFTGGSISSNSNGTVNYNQGTNGQAVAPGSYGNLTFSNFNKTLPATNVTIAGTFTPGSAGGHTVTGNTTTFNGSAAQTIPAFTFNNLTLNNSAGATLGGNVTVDGGLTLTSGTLNVSTFALTLNGAASQTGGAFSSAATGTVNYNQSSAGQNVLTGNYGNLTFSNFNKTLPSSGTIGVAGTFTPGTATGHTIAGSTFDFNGSGAQTIPAFNYFNLTSSNTGARTLASSGTIGVAGTFTPGTNAYTNTGSTVDFNGAGAQTIAPFNYNNLTVSGNRGNANVTFASGTIGVAGVFNPSVSFAIFVRTGNTFAFNGAGAQTIPQFAYNNLSTATGGTKTLGGTVDVLADLLIGTGTTLDVSASNFPLNVYGNFTNNGTFVPRTGTVTLLGSAAQTVGGTTATAFNNLTINNAAGISFGSNATVGGVLTFTSGNISTGANTLTLSGSYSRTSGHVIGNVLRNLSAGAFTYPVGTANGYSPVTFNVTAGSGNMTVKAVQGPQPNVTAATSLQRYWSLTGTGMTADLTFNYLDGDVPVGVLESDYRITRVTPPSTQTLFGSAANINAAANTAAIGGVNQFSDWTLTERFSITGTINYGITPMNQTQKQVPGVVLTVTGGTTTSANSNLSGVYTVDNLTPDTNHTVTPTKTTDVNGISAFDATMVLRHVAANGQGANALSADQQIAADTTGDTMITAFDATLILRFVASMGPNADTGQTGNWKFVTASKNYNPLANTSSGENYTAYLLGEVDGDWTPPTMLAANNRAAKQEKDTALITNESSFSPAAEAPAFVREQQEFIGKNGKKDLTEVQLLLPANLSAPKDSVVLIPVWINNDSNKQISSFSFGIRFDPSVLQPEQTAIETNNTLSGNGFMVVSDTTTAGRIGIAATGINKSAATSGPLVYLRFKVVGTKGESASTLAFESASQAGGVIEDNFGNKISSGAANGSFVRLESKQ